MTPIHTSSARDRSETDAKNRNHRYLRLAGAPISNFPDTSVNETWAVFKNDLETVFKETLGEAEFKIFKTNSHGIRIQRPRTGKQNIEGAACLIERIYEKEKSQFLNKL